jgi:hypothetical protein
VEMKAPRWAEPSVIREAFDTPKDASETRTYLHDARFCPRGVSLRLASRPFRSQRVRCGYAITV